MALNPFKRSPKVAQDQPIPVAPTIPAPDAPAAPQVGNPVPVAPPTGVPVQASAPQPSAEAVPPPTAAEPKKRRFRRNPNGVSSIKKQRDQLAADFAKAQYDLGGLVYEMGLRKDYRTDVLDSRVEILQRIDGQLAESERVLRLDEAGAAGTCPSCGAMHARNAGFCWQCGGPLAGGPPAPAPAVPQPDPAAPAQQAPSVPVPPAAMGIPQTPPVVPPPGTPQV